MRLRPSLALAAAVVLPVALAGCAAAPVPLPSPPATAGPTTAPNPGATPTTVPVPPEEDAIPVAIACADLVDADTMYRFNPNFSLLGDWTPEAGTFAAADVQAGGTACRWVNQTSGDPIDVSVSAFGEAGLTELKNAAFAEFEMVPTYGEEAYFGTDGDAGVAIAFQGSYRLVATSPWFLEPGEPEEIILGALAALP